MLMFGLDVVGSGSNPGELHNLQMWLNGSNPLTITDAFQNITPTGAGIISTNTITASATMVQLAQVGNKIRIGGTDIYTISAINVNILTTVETLTATYAALSALALDKISQITDSSGNSNTGTQNTVNNQPTLVPAIKNGKGAMGFDGLNSNAMIVTSSATIDNIFATGGTHIYVINPRGNGAGGNGFLYDKVANSSIINNFSSNLGTVIFQQTTTGTMWQWRNSPAIVPQNDYSIIIITYNATTVGTAPNVYVNSNTPSTLTVTSSGSGTANSDTGTQYTLGNRGAVDRSFDGLILQALAWNRILTTAEIAQMFRYFSNYYNIPVS